MKNVNVNELQNQVSKIMREVEGGEVYQVSRYSKPVAFLVPKEQFEASVSGSECKECVKELRQLTNLKFKNQNAK